MSTSIIDGTIEDIDVKRARGGFVVYNSIRFRLPDGSPKSVVKSVVAKDVADELQPGASGRFYLFSAFDLKGIHGFRSAGGKSVYKFPGNNAKIFIFVAVVNVLWVALRIALDGQIPFLGVGLFILGVVGYVLMSKGEREAKQQFEADGGYAPASGAPVVQPS